MSTRKSAGLLAALVVLLLFGLAANWGTPVSVQAYATPDLNGNWKLSTRHDSQTNKTPAYTIETSLPFLETDDNAGAAFNKLVNDFVAGAIADFRNATKDAVSGPGGPGTESALEIWYNVYVTDTGVFSIQFEIYQYISGAAHPASMSHSLNFSLATKAALPLANLFKPNAQYLDAISQYCIAQLQQQKRLTFPDGAAPKAENYANWNLDRGGLLITFDAYQVGAGAEGPSTVLIPWSALDSILADNAPIPYSG